MARPHARTYRPDPAAAGVYERLQAEYRTLHDQFGRGANDVMKRLRAIQLESTRPTAEARAAS
jgi:L-ribulokinase